MGAIQSRNYPNDTPQKIDISTLPNIRKIVDTTRNPIVMKVDKGDIRIVEKHFKNQVDSLKAYLNMYLLYDSYDNKNSVILDDLVKKSNNQQKEMKKLYEDKDKLRSNINEYKLESEEYEKKKKLLIVFIAIFSITIPIILIYIIKELQYYLLPTNT
tara:strand:- start:1842 stop:2312 length:471 start_codon:yes stop_codon:yes gene_type:complete